MLGIPSHSHSLRGDAKPHLITPLVCLCMEYQNLALWSMGMKSLVYFVINGVKTDLLHYRPILRIVPKVSSSSCKLHKINMNMNTKHNTKLIKGLEIGGQLVEDTELGYKTVPGLVNFVAAVAYHICLALPVAFTKTGDRLSAEPCMWHTQRIWHNQLPSRQDQCRKACKNVCSSFCESCQQVEAEVESHDPGAKFTETSAGLCMCQK